MWHSYMIFQDIQNFTCVQVKMKYITCFLLYRTEVKNQLIIKTKQIRSNRGGEHVQINYYYEKKKL